MLVYQFRVFDGWYAYALEKDAKDARQYFIDRGYPPSAISEIEKAEERDFQFKMNSISYPTFGGIGTK